MNNNQEDRFSMCYGVKNTLEKYRDVWITNAVFAATYNLWSDIIPKIEANRDTQLLEIAGITKDKLTKRAVLIEKTLFIENRIQSYANVINSEELKDSVQYSASDLKKSRDTTLIGICNGVLAKATANAAAISGYGVSEAMISELQVAITAYLNTIAKPKAAQSQAKTATQNLVALFKEADLLLTKRLDLDIELFKKSHPDFYSQYKTARMIISTGGSSTAVLGSVSNAESGEPLKGVAFTFVAETVGSMRAATGKMLKPVVKKSAAKGKFRATLPENTYRVIVEKMGYQKQELTVSVANGERTKLNVELVKN